MLIKKIKSLLRIKKNRDKLKRYFMKNKPLFLVLSTPNHGNIGDQAIAYAQKKFLRAQFPEIDYFELTSKDTVLNIDFIEKHISKKTIVFIHGGGNQGNLYPEEERIRQTIINKLIHNSIISFPQSFFIEQNNCSDKFLNAMKECYTKHMSLTLTARESFSYDLMQNNFSRVNVIESPDIVLWLSNVLEFDSQMRSKDILTLIRDDKEKFIDDRDLENLFKFIKKSFGKDIHKSDTQLGANYIVEVVERENLLESFWRDISDYKLIITDRLHGMIFSYITQTPCIVLKNKNHKIESTYNTWLKNSDKIFFLEGENYDGNTKLIDFLDNSFNNSLAPNISLDMYDQLSKEIRNLIYTT